MINDGNLLRCEGSWWGYAVNYYNSEAKKLNLVPVTSVDITLSANDGKTTDDNWGREEIDMDWDEEEGW